jgi:hypothetical protein
MPGLRRPINVSVAELVGSDEGPSVYRKTPDVRRRPGMHGITIRSRHRHFIDPPGRKN